MIRFRFGLTPLARVLPWGGQEPGREPGQEPRLHWFGLTDGWYWIELGDGRELLRYAPRTAARFRQGPGAVVSHPYVDYYVARFWEDLALLTPAVTQPVPADLLPFLVTGRDDWPPPDGWSDPAGAFQDAVRRLDRELLAAMGERVAELERDGPPPGVRVDLDQLRAEHEEDRMTWLARRADRIPDTGWPAVRAGAAELLADPGT